MRHEPRALVRYAKHPVKLMSAHPLLAGAKEMNGQQPFVEGNVAILKDRANRHRELLPASSAFPNAFSGVGLCAFLGL